MNLLKRLWNWIISKTSTAPTLAVVEEPKEEPAQIFKRLCNAAGVGDKRLDSVNAIQLFTEWYDGEADEQSVLTSIEAFKLTHPGVAAKLSGKI